MQANAAVDARGEMRSALHWLHTAFPCVFLYVPPGHAEQLPAFPVYPMSHKHTVLSSFGPEFCAHAMQALALVDPLGEIKLPVAHTVHKAFPGAFLYVPAGHAEQLAAFPVYPMLHKQAVFAMSEMEFDAHRDTCDVVQSPETPFVIHPTSMLHDALQPSLFTTFESSHASSLARTPSPHCDVHVLSFDTKTQLNPHSTEHVLEHPSPEMALLSSHVSVSRSTPSPHSACGDGKCGAGVAHTRLQYANAKFIYTR